MPPRVPRIRSRIPAPPVGRIPPARSDGDAQTQTRLPPTAQRQAHDDASIVADGSASDPAHQSPSHQHQRQHRAQPRSALHVHASGEGVRRRCAAGSVSSRRSRRDPTPIPQQSEHNQRTRTHGGRRRGGDADGRRRAQSRREGHGVRMRREENRNTHHLVLSCEQTRSPRMSSSPPPEWTVVRRGSTRTSPIVLGESPCWDPTSHRLLFVDIESGVVHRLDPLSGRSESITLPKGTLVGAIGLVEQQKAGSSGEDSGSRYWIASNHGVHLLDWSSPLVAATSPRSTLLLANPDAPDTRFNDAKVSPCGDLIAGTIVTESNAAKRRGRGHIFRLSAARFNGMGCENRIDSQILLSGATLSNGLDFETDAATGQMHLWWIDSAVPKVQCFEMHGQASPAASCSSSAAACACAAACSASNASSCSCTSAGGCGCASSCLSAACSCCCAAPSASASASASSGPVCLSPLRRSRCIRTSSPPTADAASSSVASSSSGSLSLAGVPDGMTFDSEGCLWIALSGAGVVARCTTQGQLLRVIRFPVSKVTSVCFGGPNMRTLFVTSAAKGVDMHKEPLAGSVFSVPDVGVAGRAMFRLPGRFTLEDSAPTEVMQHQSVEDIPATLRAKL